MVRFQAEAGMGTKAMIPKPACLELPVIQSMRLVRTGLLVAAWLVATDASAHHAATGRYERDTFGEISGEIVDIFWRNPHVRFVVAVIAEDGEREDWEVEFGSVNTLDRLGVSRDMVALGDRVSVYGRLGRDGLTAMFAQSIRMPDGEELPLQAGVERRYGLTESAMRDARDADPELRANIFRVWLPLERPDTGAGTTEYPLTEAGRSRRAAWDPENDPALKCIPPGLPTAMDNPYPIQFLDRGDSIDLLLEEWDGLRRIIMNGDGEPVQPRMGRSVGRWDGDTLVVETTDIDWRYIDDLGTPQSEDVVIVERFSLDSAGTNLEWVAEITDPVNFTRPVVMRATWTWVPGHEIKPFNCALSASAE